MASPYEPPVSVWRVVRKTLKSEQEKMFMREILGETLVDQTVELHAEVDNLLEIWREFRAETSAILTSPASTRQALPEPPEVRFRLKREIQFYVEALQSKADKEGRQLEQVLRTFNNDVLQYAMDVKTTKRPSTGTSKRDGRETPLLDREDGASRSAQSEALRGSVEGLKTLSTATTLATSESTASSSNASSVSTSTEGLTEDSAYGDILDKIRDELEAEVKTLYGDIDFLQCCLEGESDFRCDSSTGVNSEPTLTDLKEERTKLERHLLADGAAGDAFGGGGGREGGGGGSGNNRVVAWEKTSATGSSSGNHEANHRASGGALPLLPPSSLSSPLAKHSPLPPTSSPTSSSASSTASKRRSTKEHSSCSSAPVSAPLRAIHPTSSCASASKPPSTPLAAALDSLAPAVYNGLHEARPLDAAADRQSGDATASQLGPAARQPFGSTERLRIRDASPRAEVVVVDGVEEAKGVEGVEESMVEPREGAKRLESSSSSSKSTTSSSSTPDKGGAQSSSESVRKKTHVGITSSYSSSTATSSRAKVVTVSAVQQPSKITSTFFRAAGRGGGGGGKGAVKSVESAAAARGSEAASPDSSLDALLAPTPPPTPPNRKDLASAHAARFRRMVINCREED